MARQDAVNYIKSCRRQGFADELIRRELEKSGWPNHEIDLAFVEARVITPGAPRSFIPPSVGIVSESGPRKEESLSMQVSVPVTKDATSTPVATSSIPAQPVEPPKTEPSKQSFVPPAMSGEAFVSAKAVPAASTPMLDLQAEAAKLAVEALKAKEPVVGEQSMSVPVRIAEPPLKKSDIVTPAKPEVKVPTSPDLSELALPQVTELAPATLMSKEQPAQEPQRSQREEFLPKLSKEGVPPAGTQKNIPQSGILFTDMGGGAAIAQEPVSAPAETPPPVAKQIPAGPPPPTRSFSTSGDNLMVDLVKEETAQQFVLQTDGLSANMHPRRVKLIASLTVGILLVAGGASGAYWYYATKIQPKQILAEGLASLVSMKSYEYDTEVDIQLKNSPAKVSQNIIEPLVPQLAGLFLQAVQTSNPTSVVNSDAPQALHFKARVRGATDYRNSENPKQQSTITLVTQPFLKDNIEIEYRLLNGIYYFQFTQLPRLSDLSTTSGFSGIPALDTKQFEHKWVKIDPRDLDGLYKEYSDKIMSVEGNAVATTETSPSAVMQKSNKNNVELAQRIWQEFSKLQCSDAISEEQVKTAVVAYHCKGTLSKDALLAIVMSYAGTNTDSMPASSRADIMKELSSLHDPEVNIWVNKDTRRIAKLTVSTSIAVPSALGAGGIGGVVELMETTYFSNVDGTPSIVAPTDTRDIRGVLSDGFVMFEESMKTSQMTARDMQRLVDVRQLQSALDLYAEKKGTYPATLAPLVPEFIVIMPKDPLTRQLYIYKFISKKKYRLSIKLEDQTNPVLKNDVKPGDQFYDIEPSR